MSKKRRAEIDVKIDGKTHTLRLGIGQLEELENEFDIGIIELGIIIQSVHGIHINHVRCTILQGFAGMKVEKTPEEITEIIELIGLSASMKISADLIGASVWREEKDGDDTGGKAKASASQ